MSFRRFVIAYLNFTTREKTGIAGLLILIALFWFLPDLLFKEKDFSKEIQAFEMEIAAMNRDSAGESNDEYTTNYLQKTEPFQPFYFDPNTVDPNELEKFGIPAYVIERFAKYRMAGAKFYKKEDLKKLYGLKPDLYERMAPYIRIGKDETSEKFHKPRETEYKKSEPEIVNIELNTADSITLLRVKGIGPYLSSKILRYRKALGGYVNIDQLYEIFNIKPEQVDAIKPFVFVNAAKIKKTNINTADYERLEKHPYISGKEANAIIIYRRQHGSFKSKADLEKVYLLGRETISRIDAYLEY